jgi:hypothetical protein
MRQKGLVADDCQVSSLGSHATVIAAPDSDVMAAPPQRKLAARPPRLYLKASSSYGRIQDLPVPEVTP